MFIRDIFAQKKPVLSFEVFPPKKDSGLDNVISAVDELSKMPIDYMSVTYGAGGSNSKNTAYIASHLKNNLSIPSLAHLTCVANSKDDIKVKLQEYKDLGIENILALRGDKPKDYDGEIFPGYHYANELVEAIKDFGDFCVGGACYPECHPDSPSLDADIENLKVKVDAGVDFLVTQMFFDNDEFYKFRDKLAKKGIQTYHSRNNASYKRRSNTAYGNSFRRCVYAVKILAYDFKIPRQSGGFKTSRYCVCG